MQSVEADSEALDGLTQQSQEVSEVGILAVDGFAFVAAGGDMVAAAGLFETLRQASSAETIPKLEK